MYEEGTYHLLRVASYIRSTRALEVLQINSGTSECDHRNGQNQIDDKDIVEDFQTRLVWGHLDFDKTKSPTEV